MKEVWAPLLLIGPLIFFLCLLTASKKAVKFCKPMSCSHQVNPLAVNDACSHKYAFEAQNITSESKSNQVLLLLLLLLL